MKEHQRKGEIVWIAGCLIAKRMSEKGERERERDLINAIVSAILTLSNFFFFD